MASQAASKTTTDREEIRSWAEERGAQPSCVRRTGGKGDIGMLRLDFPGYSGEDSLEHIEWDEWFDKFEERGLALLYQETTAGGEKSNFNKIVNRQTAKGAKKRSGGETAKKAAGGKTAGKKVAGKKAVAKKAVAKKVIAKKTSGKKVAAKKTATKKAVAEKTRRR